MKQVERKFLDIFDVEEHVVLEAKRECERLGYTLQEIFRKSTSPEESNAYVVIAKRNEPLWEGKEYCVWSMYLGRGFEHGIYDVSSYKALRLCMVRIYNSNEEEDLETFDGGEF